MKDFCQNQYCENPGAKVVKVSQIATGDSTRTFCAVCEEAFAIGVQHGRTTQAAPAGRRLERFLKKDGFIIATFNEGDPSVHGPCEAWAYRGPLDLEAAAPVTFGVGADVLKALGALDGQLGCRRRRAPAGADGHTSGGPTGPRARRAAPGRRKRARGKGRPSPAA